MAFKKRRMMFIPEINPKSFVFFFERGNSGTSWSIRDYSTRSSVDEYDMSNFRWRAEDIHQKAKHSLDAPTHRTEDLAFWYEHTHECNQRFLGSTQDAHPDSASVPTPAQVRSSISASPSSNSPFPILNIQHLLGLPKSRKTQDMVRILHSPNSEDWVTWNFFQVMLEQYPNDWWRHVLTAALRRNPGLAFTLDDRSLPATKLWSLVHPPADYEAKSRARMVASGNPDWVRRARKADAVEGPSEIDVVFDHDNFLVYAEAKLGSDVSMSTTYDPKRNQISRNIDCLLASAGSRTPIFWMFARDEAPDRAYVHLMNSYKADPRLLIRDLPHRDEATLTRIAQNLTILLWSDFREMICGPGINAESTAVKRELERRILR